MNIQKWLNGNNYSLHVVKIQYLIASSRTDTQKIEERNEVMPRFKM